MRSILFLLATVTVTAPASEKIDQVRGLVRDHQLAAAESASNALVAANPADPAVYALLGSVQIAKEDADAAVAAYEKAAELAPADGDYQRQLGDAYGFAAQKAGMFGKIGYAKKCRVAYEKAVELAPQNLNARSSLMMFYQQAPGMMGGGVDKAYAQAAEIKKLDPARGRLAYASVYTADKKYDQALAEFDEVLKTSPDDYAALYQVGKLAVLSGQYLDRGLTSLRRCLELTPPAAPNTPSHAAAHWRIGNILEKKGDPAGARAAYEASLKLDPKFTSAADSLKKLK